MKTTFKLSLNNIIGAVTKAVPELAQSLEKMGMNNNVEGDTIILEGSAEYSISELGACMKLIPEAVDVLADTYRKVIKYEKEFDHTEKVEDDTTLQLRSAINSNNEYIKINNRLANDVDDLKDQLRESNSELFMSIASMSKAEEALKTSEKTISRQQDEIARLNKLIK